MKPPAAKGRMKIIDSPMYDWRKYPTSPPIITVRPAKKFRIKAFDFPRPP